ncbi:MAG: ABC transporter substrate-binding protein, partial [Candidatus Thorarchaeota archaeon]
MQIPTFQYLVLCLDADPDISIFSALRNGYGHITINCRDYPLNISAFRRAFAFAFDKTRVTAEIMDGFSQEHDSLVPYPNSWSIEDDMPY